jgi:hypothetical protein
MGLFEITWDKDEIGANIYGSDFSTRESTWGQMGRKPPFIDAIEALYQLSYDPSVVLLYRLVTRLIMEYFLKTPKMLIP